MARKAIGVPHVVIGGLQVTVSSARKLAQVMIEQVKQNVNIDWQVRENARAQIRVFVKRLLRKFGYPPDMQQRASELVLEQAEVLSVISRSEDRFSGCSGGQTV